MKSRARRTSIRVILSRVDLPLIRRKINPLRWAPSGKKTENVGQLDSPAMPQALPITY